LYTKSAASVQRQRRRGAQDVDVVAAAAGREVIASKSPVLPLIVAGAMPARSNVMREP
jgi:hypothetical protein